jgi:hypothetical protein
MASRVPALRLDGGAEGAAKMKKNHTCLMTMEDNTITTVYFKCGRPAKFVTEWRGLSPLGWPKLYLCGVHARAIQMTNERLGIKTPILKL